MIEANLIGEYHISLRNNKCYRFLGETKGGEPVPLRLSSK
jgi:hypothetical protein